MAENTKSPDDNNPWETHNIEISDKPSTKNPENYYVKIWIKSVDDFVKHPDYGNGAVFGKLLVTFVDIVGLVTNVRRSKTALSYFVDDGTGVVNVFWKPDTATQERVAKIKSSLFEDSFLGVDKEHLSGAGKLIESLEKQIQAESEILNIGDIVHVQGKLSFYGEQWSIFANQIRRVEDPNEESARSLELDNLYKNIYKQK